MAWQSAHSVTKFSSESSPEWLRNCLWGLRIVAGVAAILFVGDLEVRHRAAGLTPPVVATQDLLAQTFVRQGIQPQASDFGATYSQDVFSRRFSRKACCS
jgi:hypothetical protein